MSRTKFALMLLVLAALLLAGCAQQGAQTSPTPMLTPAPTPTETIEPTPSSAPAVAPAYSPPPAPTPITFPTKGYISKEGVNLRAEANKSAAIVEVLGQNAVINIVSLESGWYRVDLQGTTAYVSEELAALGDPPRKHNMYYAKVNVKEAPLYKSPSAKEASERKLVKGDIVKVLRTLDGYCHIVCDDKLQRYIKATEITKITDEEASAAPASKPSTAPAKTPSAKPSAPPAKTPPAKSSTSPTKTPSPKPSASSAA